METFAKYTGCGNDFILFDNTLNRFPSHDKKVIQHLCHRQKGIGGDGLILLENSTQADYRMRIFNPDGNEADMCGNGIRCLARFLEHLGKKQSTYRIETPKRILTLSHQGPHIAVEMGNPVDMRWDISLPIDNILCQIDFLNTGVPHAVLFVNDVDIIDLNVLAPHLRFHPVFQPDGTNVNIAQIISKDKIKLRTYERGVENETLACGTGATAAALAAAYRFNLVGPITVQTKLNEYLVISFKLDKGIFSHVTLTGPAHRTFQGTVAL